MSVKDVAFNNDGVEFLSASFDRYIKLWDTETGCFIISGLTYCYYAITTVLSSSSPISFNGIKLRDFESYDVGEQESS